MYSGPREGLVGWFTGLGYGYDPIVQGSPSDWVMDLVNIGFGEQQVCMPISNDPQLSAWPRAG